MSTGNDDIMAGLREMLPTIPSGARPVFLTTIGASMEMAAGDAGRTVLLLRAALAQAEVWAHDERSKLMRQRGGTRG